jgi:hypothetical protein
MALSLDMDVHVPIAVTEGLRRRGLDVLASQDDGTVRMSDEELLVRATELRRVLFTQDDDLLQIASNWQEAGRSFAGIVYAHQLLAGIGRLVDDLELVCGVCGAEELSNSVTFLPLR